MLFNLFSDGPAYFFSTGTVRLNCHTDLITIGLTKDDVAAFADDVFKGHIFPNGTLKDFTRRKVLASTFLDVAVPNGTYGSPPPTGYNATLLNIKVADVLDYFGDSHFNIIWATVVSLFSSLLTDVIPVILVDKRKTVRPPYIFVEKDASNKVKLKGIR